MVNRPGFLARNVCRRVSSVLLVYGTPPTCRVRAGLWRSWLRAGHNTSQLTCLSNIVQVLPSRAVFPSVACIPILLLSVM
jgi:hypothetical protein